MAEYDWDEMSLVSLWRHGGQMTFFCFDFPIFLRHKLTTDLANYGLSLVDNPYSVHLIIVEAAVQEYDHSIQTIRRQLRTMEKQQLDRNSQVVQKNDHELQEIKKSIICSIETLTVAVNTVRDMSAQHVEVLKELRLHPDQDSKSTTGSLKFQLQMLENLQARNESLAARLQTLQENRRAEAMDTLTRLNRDTLRMKYLSQNISRGYSLMFFLLLPGIFISVRWKER